MSDLTKKLRKEIRDLEESVDYERRQKDAAREMQKVAEARLEELRGSIRSVREADGIMERERLSELDWLRIFVEHVVVSPEVIYSLAKIESIRSKEQRKDRNQEFERQMRREKIYAAQAAKNPNQTMASNDKPMGLQRPDIAELRPNIPFGSIKDY